jgi:2-polyprenyl-3-methyl-5-hydroxy-6-metoxy-1,4-benzoquinol methylase
VADQGAEGLLSPYLRRMRVQAARPYLTGRVLDIGCGSGALAALVAAEDYLGVDRDPSVLAIARERFPRHRFTTALPSPEQKFDTVVSLAVIEHVHDPGAFLGNAARHLKAHRHARIVITTPHPKLEWLHELGASLGLFSRHASEEHESLLDRAALGTHAARARLRLTDYRRFLLGANQLAVFADA